MIPSSRRLRASCLLLLAFWVTTAACAEEVQLRMSWWGGN